MVKIKKFDGADFGLWKMKIENFLYQKKVYQPLIGKNPVDKKEDDWNLLDRQALAIIWLTLSCNVAFNIAQKKPQWVLWRLFLACTKSRQP